mmetsp:Transcript_41063/g.71077  ORF Transcript_41063/g.71077 Transcript_41063/m.71077 type:complete len:296 (+) Transcript_41063:189-1076(+)
MKLHPYYCCTNISPGRTHPRTPATHCFRTPNHSCRHCVLRNDPSSNPSSHPHSRSLNRRHRCYNSRPSWRWTGCPHCQELPIAQSPCAHSTNSRPIHRSPITGPKSRRCRSSAVHQGESRCCLRYSGRTAPWVGHWECVLSLAHCAEKKLMAWSHCGPNCPCPCGAWYPERPTGKFACARSTSNKHFDPGPTVAPTNHCCGTFAERPAGSPRHPGRSARLVGHPARVQSLALSDEQWIRRGAAGCSSDLRNRHDVTMVPRPWRTTAAAATALPLVAWLFPPCLARLVASWPRWPR